MCRFKYAGTSTYILVLVNIVFTINKLDKTIIPL